MKNVFKTFFCSTLLFLAASTSFANDFVKFKGWKEAETSHFRFIYEAASEAAAKKYAEFADEAWDKIAKVYSMPQEKTNVYVFSRLNIVNAYTFFTPPEIVMYDSPLIYSEFGFREDWMKLFFTHELIHIANITFEDKNYLSSKIFGELFRGMDYNRIPGWALEGLTTVLETELTNGGRGRSPYFELNYKAPTMDNALIPYRLIGTEQEPPYSQIYVMGYLIMRSIADRWGLQALADIERNRSFDCSWEESVRLVTGFTPEDIYRQAKIALEKKYAKERQIPEGKIISVNYMNSNYSKPAIVLDDGSIVALKEDLADSYVVLLKPEKNDGVQYYEDLVSGAVENELKETILLKGASEITADQDLNIYYTSPINRYDRKPYNESQYQIFKWTRDGNQLINEQLTKDQSSYYQPAVSRDGKVLVAVEQSGLKMRLVKIDQQTGEKTVMLEDEKYSFIQPALNADGSKMAFLILKDDRSCVALADTKTLEYKIVNNTDYDYIVDPSNPFFNQDGKLTFSSNDRGRLEAYEASLNSDGQTFTCTPMLSDPIGVLWTYKNQMGVFYRSQASTGSVIKIKPLEEWGKAADFEGPSPAGSIMTFGQLQDDYPDFNPYAELAAEEEKTTFKVRSEEKIQKLSQLPEASTELTEEKNFRPYLSTLMSLPLINLLSHESDSYIGIGAIYLGALPRLQMRQGIIALDAFYYPEINNLTGEFLAEIPLFAGTLDLFAGRDSSFLESTKNKDKFSIQNTLVAGYSLPIISREQFISSKNLKFLGFVGAAFTQYDDKAFAINTNLPFSKQLVFQTGLEYIQSKRLIKDGSFSFAITNLALGSYNFDRKKLFAGYEGEYNFTLAQNNLKQEGSLIVRYSDFPAEELPFMSRAHFKGQGENCLFPGKILMSYSYIIPGLFSNMGDLNLVFQGLASFGKNTVDKGTPETGKFLNLNLEKKLNAAAEICFNLGVEQKLSFGYAGLFDFTKPMSDAKWSFYISCKMNWLRL